MHLNTHHREHTSRTDVRCRSDPTSLTPPPYIFLTQAAQRKSYEEQAYPVRLYYVKCERRTVCLRQEDLARRAGLSTQTARNVEAGRFEPETRTLRKIAGARGTAGRTAGTGIALQRSQVSS